MNLWLQESNLWRHKNVYLFKDISTIDQQSVFWSVGYKSASMRKKNKPMKNQGKYNLSHLM